MPNTPRKTPLNDGSAESKREAEVGDRLLLTVRLHFETARVAFMLTVVLSVLTHLHEWLYLKATVGHIGDAKGGLCYMLPLVPKLLVCSSLQYVSSVGGFLVLGGFSSLTYVSSHLLACYYKKACH